jgi:hypothetical protein
MPLTPSPPLTVRLSVQIVDRCGILGNAKKDMQVKYKIDTAIKILSVRGSFLSLSFLAVLRNPFGRLPSPRRSPIPSASLARSLRLSSRHVLSSLLASPSRHSADSSLPHWPGYCWRHHCLIFLLICLSMHTYPLLFLLPSRPRFTIKDTTLAYDLMASISLTC